MLRYEKVDALNESNTLSSIQYKHTFVRSMGWYESRGAIFIAMEFMAHGDLQKYMPDVTTQKFSVQETQDVVSQLVEGLFFLHDNDFSHRDLKPAVSAMANHLCVLFNTSRRTFL